LGGTDAYEISARPDPRSDAVTPRQALEAELKGLEESLLDPDIRKSTQLVELLADEFVEFGSSGRVYAKDDLVALLQAESPVVQTTSDFHLTTLAPDVALLTYKVRRHSEPVVDTLRSSLWRRSDGKWKMVFHQATVTPVT
jgi:hypothetical protein